MLPMKEYDKAVRKFVSTYVNNLTPDQMRNHLTEQFHIDLENIRQDTGQNDVFLEMVNWDYEVAEPILKEFNIDEEELS